MAHVADGVPVPVVRGLVWITLTRNTGIAFGVFRGIGAWWLIFLVSAAMVFLVVSLKRFLARPGLALLLGGIVSSLIDRFRFGAVIDFIDIKVWPVFNLSDIFICSGAVLLAGYLLGEKKQI